MDVSTIRIRHYAPEGAQCAPVKETYETLSNMMEQLGPKLARIGFPVTLEKASSEGDPSKNNMVTLESAGIDFPETPLDEILGLEASPKPCGCSAGEGHGECRPSRSPAKPIKRSLPGSSPTACSGWPFHPPVAAAAAAAPAVEAEGSSKRAAVGSPLTQHSWRGGSSWKSPG